MKDNTGNIWSKARGTLGAWESTPALVVLITMNIFLNERICYSSCWQTVPSVYHRNIHLHLTHMQIIVDSEFRGGWINDY